MFIIHLFDKELLVFHFVSCLPASLTIAIAVELEKVVEKVFKK